MTTLRLISWNVNGIRAIAKKGFCEWFGLEKPDILCLQETKAEPGQLSPSLVDLLGYSAFFCVGERKGYSGVGLYTRIQPAAIANGFGVERFENEGRIIIADYESFILCNIYFPNGKASPERLQYKIDFYDAFLSFADGCIADGKALIICGDVNTAHREIDLTHPKENGKVSGFLPQERAWIDKLIEHGFIDTFRVYHPEPAQYTWWDQKTRARERNVGWRIDYFFISENLAGKLRDAFILPEVMGSDHCPLGITIDV